MLQILEKSSKNVQNKLSNDLRRLNNSPQPWTTCASLTPHSPVFFSCRTLAKEPRTWERAAKFKKSSKKVEKKFKKSSKKVQKKFSNDLQSQKRADHSLGQPASLCLHILLYFVHAEPLLRNLKSRSMETHSEKVKQKFNRRPKRPSKVPEHAPCKHQRNTLLAKRGRHVEPDVQ